VATAFFLSILGETRLSSADGSDCTPKSRKARAVLVLLALSHQQSVIRERLAAYLWPDSEPDKAKASLRQTVGELRSVLDIDPGQTTMVISRDRIALAAGQVICDSVALLSALRDGNLDSAVSILRTWQGNYLADIAGINDQLHDWVQSERASFDEQLRVATETQVGDLLEKAAFDVVRTLAGHILAHAPENEVLTRAAMQADAALGDVPMLHRRFQALREALESVYGVEPASATRQLFASLAEDAGKSGRTGPDAGPDAGPASVLDGLLTVFVPKFDDSVLDSEHRQLLQTVYEDVIQGLSRFKELRLLAVDALPSASDQYLYGSANSLFALTLFCRKNGQHIKLSARINRLLDGHILWSEAFNLNNLSNAELVQQVIERFTGALLPALDQFEHRRSETASSPKDAHEFYTKGRLLATHALDHRQAKKAADFLEQAIGLNPNLGLAYPVLARLYNTGMLFSLSAPKMRELRLRALELNRKAVELDRNSPHAHICLGWSYLWLREWDLARDAFERGYELNPFYAERVLEIACGMAYLGDYERADQLFQRCLALNPFPRDQYYVDLGWLETLRGNHQAARRYFGTIGGMDIFGRAQILISSVFGGISEPGLDHVKAILQHVRETRCTDGDLSPEAIASWLMEHIPLSDLELAFRVKSALVRALSIAV
jgi:DNA-binding SARP family transcriptional activator/Tfp pilus assembly protein PilF/TolB-like protein